MTVTCDRSGRELTTKYATTAFGADRETVEEAFPGDVVGLVNATGLQLGDTIYDAGPTACRSRSRRSRASRPRCSPRPGRSTPAGPSSSGAGLEQLDEEGVVQVLRDPDLGDTDAVLAAVGALQFEVFGHRLASEFNAPAEILQRRYQAIRRTDQQSAARLREIGGIRILQPLRRRARRPVREPLPPRAPRGRRARADCSSRSSPAPSPSSDRSPSGRNGRVRCELAPDRRSAVRSPARAPPALADAGAGRRPVLLTCVRCDEAGPPVSDVRSGDADSPCVGSGRAPRARCARVAGGGGR